VLKLEEEFRNHPGINLMRDGFPLVIASDGPGIWGSRPLSDDWYIAFMAMGGRDVDLRFLKQLAMNSIEYVILFICWSMKTHYNYNDFDIHLSHCKYFTQI